MVILHEDLRQPWRDPDEGADWLDVRVAALFADGLEWLPGARDLLAAVRSADLPTALVTNTRRTLVQVALATLGEHNFDAVVCGDDVVSTKPDPAPYLTAAASLGVDPARCVAVEDSPAGVASALGAGCVVLAVPHEVEIVGVDVTIVDSLVEVDLDLLRALVRDRSGGGGRRR
jgi:HAD superfamily hydrolase (TIGR01509 family)